MVRSMSNSSKLKLAPQLSPETAVARRAQIGRFFAERRLQAGLTTADVAKELDLESSDIVEAYETGKVGIPVEDIFAMTNLMNIPPEEVMELIHELSAFGAE